MSTGSPFTENEHKCIVLAGLFHDLGHGIYSHLFDRKVMKAILPYATFSAEPEQPHLAANSLGESAVDNKTMSIDQLLGDGENPSAAQQA